MRLYRPSSYNVMNGVTAIQFSTMNDMIGAAYKHGQVKLYPTADLMSGVGSRTAPKSYISEILTLENRENPYG